MVYNDSSTKGIIMSDSPIQNRNTYVIYVPNQGFMKNRHGDFIDDFTLARIFGTEKGALLAQTQSKSLKGIDSYVVDVKMELDPRKIFKKILIGK